MRYVSTRGGAPILDFEGALLAGLAVDGGLYLPESWPDFSAAEWRALRGRPYAEIAAAVMAPFTEGSVSRDALRTLCEEAYGGFGHRAVAPLRQYGPDDWLLELFQGPTLAFKDYAMQPLARLFDAALEKRGARATIVGATSGDTGPAAMAACGGRAAVDIFILFPDGRTSPVQRRQMTTLRDPNAHALAILGSFDSCQDLVKAMFADAGFRTDLGLTAVNSINWARVMAQIVYYAHAGLSLGAPDRPVAFSVPTGNFGNVFAGYAAKKMGLPIAKLIVGSNANDILPRWFEANDMSVRTVVPTYSPSMDIQISSNFERLLFELSGRKGDEVTRRMGAFRETGRLEAPEAWRDAAAGLFAAHALDDDETVAEISRIHRETGMIVDPHSAIGMAALDAHAGGLEPGVARIAVATAHPAKFPDAVAAALGQAAYDRRLDSQKDQPERATRLKPALDDVQAHIRDAARITRAAA